MPPILLALLAALAASVLLTVGLGPAPVGLADSWSILLHQLGAPVAPAWQPGQDLIVWQLRLPRVLLGGLVGAGLALVGAVLQAATRNKLADPHLLGVSSGATLGAVSVLLFTGNLAGSLTLPLAAFAGALLSTALVMAVALRQRRLQAERLLLAGVAVSFFMMALANLLIYLGDHRSTSSVLFWMLGGLGQARWELLPVPALALGSGLLALAALGRPLNALMAGEQTAVTLGIQVSRLRLAVFAVSSLMTGVMVAVSGAIGFVGLMIPHIARRFVGADHRRLLPVCALSGAIFLIWVDAAARTLIAPEDIPVGVGTAAIGGAFFIWLMRAR
ncbi:iron ABC transporter permease [Chromobacterium subtsugae]|uniref:Iron ABC transporter permease n=1 Tax=Chromobacterium subtsugae TaxID=251747 RepID=A0ABS7FBM8_9NEIS|nr:iron ABC transporter permease [Chromobacterium subtsugae]KUM04758.1 ABC transporter permease [Chromobacterium subtsugae]KZE85682.1 ABC transporter permease [Chromobacterium sp. F49]MBW7566070.1 iron ABC transporter permease [Chromobacterium subtsugae]MBW8287191.1 iron ABC transporter permease [Chromobacterium subtsugae]